MPYSHISKKPEGQLTRGKTASNRLRRVDNFILLYEPLLLTRTDGMFSDAIFVDLGYGFDARTTLESAARFRRVNPDLKILGVGIEALVFSTNFRLGFDVEEFQTVLPKNLIHHVQKGEPIYDFFEAWKASAA